MMQRKLFGFTANGLAKPENGSAGLLGRPYPAWQYLLGQFNEVLDLTPEQLSRVQPALDRAGANFSLIRLEATQKAQGIIRDTIKNVRPLLNAEQQRIIDMWQRIAVADQAGTAVRE
jgi:hypothetical protein